MPEPTLWPLLRKFRRTYLCASKVYRKLGKLGPLSLRIHFVALKSGGFQITVKNQVPDEDLVTQLAILMYPLLDSHSDLYWQRILAVLEERFAKEIPQAVQDRLNAHALRLSQNNAIPIKFNDEWLDPQQVYLQMARGVYFNQEPQARSNIEKLLAVRPMGPILWNWFYDYTLTGFEVTSALYDIFLEFRKTAAFQELYREQGTGPWRCIYCGPREASFSSEEHPLSESLGNDELILGKGHTCDPCNHGPLAFLDRALLEFAPIAFLRVIYVPHVKGGKLPKANLQNMQIKKTAPTRIEILAKDDTGLPRDQEDLADGWVRFVLRARGGRFNPVLIARAYFKIALGTVAYDAGAEFALAERYDAARAFIRGEQGFPNPLILKTSGEPHGGITVQWRKLEPGTFFGIDIFGIVAAFNLEVEPSVQLPDNLDNSGFVAFNLRKPDASAQPNFYGISPT